MKKSIFVAIIMLLVGLIQAVSAQSNAYKPPTPDTRVFEMRIYYTEDGKLEDLIRRFKNHTTKLFEKHGMENIGYWLPINNMPNRLVYVLAYPSMEARDAAWKAFNDDPKWKKVRTKSEKNGNIVQSVVSIFMTATDFSPAITASKKGNRVFELRTYTIAPQKLEDLKARFRNHTMALFAKHGAENMPYWTTIEKEGVQPKLIYFLAHKSEAAGKKTIEDMVKDPEWIKISTESEKNGKLIEKIESVFMTPLPFSKMK